MDRTEQSLKLTVDRNQKIPIFKIVHSQRQYITYCSLDMHEKR